MGGMEKFCQKWMGSQEWGGGGGEFEGGFFNGGVEHFKSLQLF